LALNRSKGEKENMARKESTTKEAPAKASAGALSFSTSASSGDSNGAGDLDEQDEEDTDSQAESEQGEGNESPSKPLASSAPPAISRSAIARATRAGLTDEEIDGCETEAALLRAASIAERYMSQRPRSNQQQQEKPAASVEAFNVDEIPDFDETKYDDDAKPSVKALNGAKKALKIYGQRIESLEGQLAKALEESAGVRDMFSRVGQRDWLEHKFASVEGGEEIYGKGGYYAVKDSAAHLAARNKLVKLYEEMRRKDSLIDEAAFEAAHQQAFGKERSALAGRQKQNESQVIGRPTQRKRADKSGSGGFESAVEKARNILKAGA
jgi:hypothetical protein